MIRTTPGDQSDPDPDLKRQALLVAVGWTVLLLLLGAWAVQHELAAARALVLNEAEAHFNKDLAVRLWASTHGGVYVPVNERTPPNPSLAHIPDRDIRTDSGIELTLMNPAYMLRQMMEEYSDLYGVKGRIVSDKPLRAANAPDSWEQAALNAFRLGETRAEAFTDIDGEPHLRWMEPLMVVPSCLKCHGHQGYEVGDVRGGVGVSVPFAPYLAAAWSSIRVYVLSLGVLWLLGLVGIAQAQRTIARRFAERRRAEKALLDERNLFLTGPTMVFHWEAVQGWPVRYASANTSQILGWSPEELQGGIPAYADLIHADELQRVADEVNQHSQAGDAHFAHQPYRLRCRDDSFVWVFDTTSILRDATGTVTGYLGYLVDITSQYESEQRLELALDGSRAGLWDWHVPSGTTVFNERWAEIVGYTLDELEPVSLQTWIDLCHPDDLQRSMDQLEAHFAGRTDSYRCEARMKHKDGHWVWVLDQGKVMERDGEGKPMRMAGTHIDITAQKHMEILLAAERDLARAWAGAATFEKRLRLCLETAISIADMDCGGVYLIDEAQGGLKLSVHQGMPEAFLAQAAYLNVDSDQVRLVHQGKPVYTRHQELVANIRNPAITSLEGLRAIAVIPVIYRDRVVACLNVASYVLDRVPQQARTYLEGIAHYIGVFIHQELQALKIRQNRKDMRALFNTVEDMLFILDTQGTIIGHNRMVSQRLGYAADELIGKSVLYVHPAERHAEAQAVTTAMMRGEIEICSIPLQTRTGDLIPVETKVATGHWQGREAILGVCRDITDRLEIENRRVQIEKAESLSRMAGAVAHHFNNQLMAVLGYLELFQDNLPVDTEHTEYLEGAQKAARCAADISTNILNYLGETTQRPTAVNLSSTCHEHLMHLREAAPDGVLLDAKLPLPGPVVSADPALITKLLDILVTNSWEAADKTAACIEIATGVAGRDEIAQVRRSPPEWAPVADRYAFLRVSDNGRGLDETTIGLIFDPFYTDKFTGRGLGLAMALGIVKSWGGCITVESVVGWGSTFRVLLPLLSETVFQQEG